MAVASSITGIRRIVDLAAQIEADIRRRDLKPGDRYLRTDETAKMLGVEARVANRALQLLVQRRVLERRRRVGTFVAHQQTYATQTTIECIHLLASDRQRTIEAMFESGELLGLQKVFPGVRIVIDVVPTVDEQSFLENIVAAARRVSGREGFVLYGSTLLMQRVIAESGLPAVVRGHLYPSIIGLPFLSSDQSSTGRLAVEYLIRQGHRRIVLLLRTRMLPGDNIRIEAALGAIQSAGLPAKAISIHFVPDDTAATRATVLEILSESPERPGIITASESVADAAWETVTSQGLAPLQDVTVVTIDYPLPVGVNPRYPFIERTLTSSEQGALLGKMLKQMSLEGADATPNELIPVRLKVPDDSQ